MDGVFPADALTNGPLLQLEPTLKVPSAAPKQVRAKTPFFLQDFWRFGCVNAEIASDCDCAILVR